MVGIFAGRHFPVGNCPAPCLGYSFDQDTPVWPIITGRLPVTISLAVGGAVVFLIVGVGLGMIAAARRGKLIDKVATTLSMFMYSMQIYFLGPIALAILVYGLHLFNNPAYVPFTQDPWGWFTGLLIPWAVLATIFVGAYTRMTRSLLIEQFQEEHVKMARAKGMSTPFVFFRYAWRGAMAMIITQFGMDFSSLLGGAIITEYTFSLQGLGAFSVEATDKSDLPSIMGIMLFGAALIVIFNAAIDACYAVIDPRVRLN
jgi:peptide/nickel transport system permease protein